ncbi:HFL102Wp [Eremothecium sinecaudum]|uniref:HFL102Wp n=1 Tax=Eremothecium sinecaudum TaxID=45286 RepID=A0A0X8HUJ4_9SACH|nr:HFL102Wp [Eremothecium sinecaudum]AMD21754.1 HFL102Wp [Eremothecium sinecaudum]
MRRSIVEVDRRTLRYKCRNRVARLRQSRLFEFDVPRTRNLLGSRSREVKKEIITIDDKEDEVVLIDDDGDDDDDDDDDDEADVDSCTTDGFAKCTSHVVSEGVTDLPGTFYVEPQIQCPICCKNLSQLPLYAREAHCDQCTTGEQPVVRKRQRNVPLTDVKMVKFRTLTVVVDGFMFMDHEDVKDYFLSHFHADHYQGICKSWNQGQLYCSQLTADLVMLKFQISSERLTILHPGKVYYITPEVRCTALDANHCPGALIFLFEEVDVHGNVRRSVLHTGDFRANNEIIQQISRITGGRPLDLVYLDTTYLNPYFHFPSQESVLEATAALALSINSKGLQAHFQDKQLSIMAFAKASVKVQSKFRYLYLVGAYSIGKERLAVAIAQKLNTKLYIARDSARYHMVMKYINWFPEGIITHDPFLSCVHLVSFEVLSSKDSINGYLHGFPSHLYNDVIGFKPTGWTFNSNSKYIPSDVIIERFKHDNERYKFVVDLLNNSKVDELTLDNFKTQYRPSKRYQMFKAPYSEHSSFKDLCNFGTSLEMLSIKSTVGLNDVDMHALWFNTWTIIRDSKDCII